MASLAGQARRHPVGRQQQRVAIARAPPMSWCRSPRSIWADEPISPRSIRGNTKWWMDALLHIKRPLRPHHRDLQPAHSLGPGGGK